MKKILILIILMMAIYGCIDIYGNSNKKNTTAYLNDTTQNKGDVVTATPQTNNTHSVCNINKCVQIDGTGSNECNADQDCGLKVDSCNKYSKCSECVISVGCGWCNASSTCQSSGSVCTDGLETTCTISPEQPTGCGKYSNCGDCIQKGSSCKWCIEKSTCAEATDSSLCTVGLGWLTKDYQCYITSK